MAETAFEILQVLKFYLFILSLLFLDKHLKNSIDY